VPPFVRGPPGGLTLENTPPTAPATTANVVTHPGHLSSHPQGRVYADDAQHELRALPPRHVLDARDRLVQLLHQDGLHRAGRRTQDPQALGILGVGIIVQRLIPAQLENFGREKDALRVPLAPIQLDDESHE